MSYKKEDKIVWMHMDFSGRINIKNMFAILSDWLLVFQNYEKSHNYIQEKLRIYFKPWKCNCLIMTEYNIALKYNSIY